MHLNFARPVIFFLRKSLYGEKSSKLGTDGLSDEDREWLKTVKVSDFTEAHWSRFNTICERRDAVCGKPTYEEIIERWKKCPGYSEGDPDGTANPLPRQSMLNALKKPTSH